MTTQSVISIPADDTTFEQNVAILFRGILGDPNTKRVAKSGKNQKGIDVFGRRDRDAKQPVGIQCKLRTTNRKLTETEARVELTKAFAFTPALTEFFIVTTAVAGAGGERARHRHPDLGLEHASGSHCRRPESTRCVRSGP